MKRFRIVIAIIAILTTHLVSIPAAQAAVCVSNKSTFTGNGSIGLSNVVYTVESFTSVVAGCTWTVPAGVIRVDALVIGGGGGGGSWVGAGGGAGAMIDTTSLTVTPGASISITVGDGGVGSITDDRSGQRYQAYGASGSNSIFNGITANGGGVGASWNQAAGNGGSGGGASGNVGPSVGTKLNALYGNDGGASNANYVYGYPTGGGGGAGAVGGAAYLVSGQPSTSGAGGAGKVSTITGSSVTYAGGGGGGCHNNGSYICSAGAGGSGGGGAGDAWGASHLIVTGASGASNTGGGGGGSGGPYYNPGTSSTGGKGGSGVVIVRYISNLVLNPALGSGRVNATTATYRAPTAFTINAPVNGKATFYERGKVISTCKNKNAVAGGTVTCTWKPSVRGKVSLRVDYFQTGSTTLLERGNFEVWVNNRSGAR